MYLLHRTNQMDGHVNLRDAAKGECSYKDPKSGKEYSLKSKVPIFLSEQMGVSSAASKLCVAISTFPSQLFWGAAQAALVCACLRGIDFGCFCAARCTDGAATWVAST